MPFVINQAWSGGFHRMIPRLAWQTSLICIAAAAALGQPSYEVPTPPVLARDSLWMEWLIGGIFVLGCLVVAFKGAKRSKLD